MEISIAEEDQPLLLHMTFNSGAGGRDGGNWSRMEGTEVGDEDVESGGDDEDSYLQFLSLVEFSLNLTM